jgi:hypothetical protein
MLVAILAMAVIVIAPVAVVPVVIVLANHAVALAVRSDDATGGQNQEPGDHAALDESIQCIQGIPRFSSVSSGYPHWHTLRVAAPCRISRTRINRL